MLNVSLDTFFVILGTFFTSQKETNYELITTLCTPQTVFDRNAKSKCIFTELCALSPEYIFKRIAKFHLKIFINIGAVNLQISRTKYIGFRHVNLCSHWSGSDLCRQDNAAVHRERENRANVNTWTIRLHRSNSVASQQSCGLLDLREATGACVLHRIHDVAQLNSCLSEEWEYFEMISWS